MTVPGVLSSVPLKPLSGANKVIRSLGISNFRCFKTAKLDDLRRFNVITGTNGSGKTALLEALFVAGGNSAEIYLRANAWRGRDRITLRAGGTTADLVSMFEDFFYQFDCNNGISIRFKDSLLGEREVRVVAAPVERVSLPFESKTSEAIVSRDLRFIWKSAKGESESKVEVTSEGMNISNPQDVFPMVFLNPSTISSVKENATRYSSLSQQNAEKPLLVAVQRLFPEVEALTVLASGEVSLVSASVRGVSRKIPVGLLSAGANKFLAILLAIATSPRGVVLIDEIENGMYYKVLRDMWVVLAEFAEEHNAQIFATTHSSEFLQSIAPIVGKNRKDYALLHTDKTNGESRLIEFSGEKFADALQTGFDVR